MDHIEPPSQSVVDWEKLKQQTMHPALVALLRNGKPSPDEIDIFLERHEIPLTEPGVVTLLWRGAADRVEVLRWIHAGIDRTPFLRLPGTDLWVLRLPAEDGGRFEYKLNIRRGPHEDWILDPLNPARASDPFGENSVCQTHGYARPEWSKPHGAPQGRFETVEVDSRTFAERRSEQVYLPHGYDPARQHPLLMIHDGEDYMSYADLSVSLDNLIAAGDIPPTVVVLVQSGDRMELYPRGRRHARYLVQELLPVVAARYAISDEAADRVLLGASLGAVASLSTAFRYPGTFGGLVLKSGSFILDQNKLENRTHPVFHRISRLVQAMRRAPNLPPTRAFVSTGELEGLADENRALASFLREHGVDVKFQSSWDGHHWHNWRDQLRDGLMWVLRPDRHRK